MNRTTERALYFIGQIPSLILTGLVRLYQWTISPWLPSACRYTPSCSEYAVIALREYGAVKGTILAIWRILRCAPWGSHGHDPPRWFGEEKGGGVGGNVVDARRHDHTPARPHAVDTDASPVGNS